MPSEDVRITRSAGINFGVPNSEYRLRIDPVTGEALSCYNQDTDTEYIGGGGGDSDFSTAEVTISFGENIGNTSITIPTVLETPYEGSLAFTLQTSAGAPATEETVTAILYKNKCLCQCMTALGVIRTTGNITESGGIITIAGDGTIEVVAET